ncbi:MAG TPA: glutaredoxin domain-containing protein [Roseiflexaceae bacterium]|nr:glutaredoxin domain-containing protein [Roseiflexaceae bacterium]HMP38823.1 glutaredoxin domain-containing protein [Roseiflexaceae bacterium]
MSNPAITMYGTPWCGDCRRVRRLFDEHQIGYSYIDIEQDDKARQYVIDVNRGNQSVPTIIFPDGSVLVEPSNSTLKQKLELLGIA